MTPQDIITLARYVLNDTDSGTYRQSNAELLGYVNDGVVALSNLRPEIFSAVGDVTCTPGAVEHALTFPEAQALLGVLCIHGGAALTPFDVAAMDQFNPNWRTDTAGDAKQWAKMPGDPLRFFVYPKAPVTAQVLDVRYVAVPTALAISDTIAEVPAAYQPALVDYVVFRSESKDDEHVNSGRSTAHYQAFVNAVKGG
jgi:hypothetical protein